MSIFTNLSLRRKILISILTSVAIVLILVISFIGLNSRNQVYRVTTQLADSYAGEYANLTRVSLNSYMDVARLLTQIFENYETIPEESRREVLSSILQHTLNENPDYLSVWAILLPATIDNLDSLYYNQVGSNVLGSFRYVYYRDMGNTHLSDYIEQDPEKVSSGYIFDLVKSRMKEVIVDPSDYSYRSDGTNAIFQTNMVLPIEINGQFGGILGIDVPMGYLQEMIDSYEPIEGSFAFLMTGDTKLVSFPEKLAVGKPLAESGLIIDDTQMLIEQISNNNTFSFNTHNINGEDFYVSIVSVPVGNTGTPWYVGFAFPHSVIKTDANSVFLMALLAGVLGLMLVAGVVWYVSNEITKPLRKLTFAINRISLGQADDSLKQEVKSGDEIGQMAAAMNGYIDGYISKSKFAEDIGSNKLDSDLPNVNDQDRLAKSLIVMRDSLKKAREDEFLRIEEDKKRNWVNEGLNKFADLLTKNNDNLEKLSFEIIKNLVHYMDANQAGLFIKNVDDSEGVVFELTAAYAYNRKKHLEKRILLGEGLVGTCAVEKKSIYLTKIPQGYINVTSGLGEANPDTILIVPMKKEEEILGVIEIASFKPIEPYRREFVEKIAENMALTIQAVKINVRTAILLEKSQQQAEEMRAQEEEMRQNMEELEATQEAMSEKERESQSLIEGLEREIALKEDELKQLRNNL